MHPLFTCSHAQYFCHPVMGGGNSGPSEPHCAFSPAHTPAHLPYGSCAGIHKHKQPSNPANFHLCLITFFCDLQTYTYLIRMMSGRFTTPIFHLETQEAEDVRVDVGGKERRLRGDVTIGKGHFQFHKLFSKVKGLSLEKRLLR